MNRIVDRRDKDFDGVFVVAVKTTGIFCRPSCPARPLAKNRLFLPTAGDALRAGYRPCKRCRPLLAGGAVPSWMAQLLDLVESSPSARVSDKDLRSLGIDSVAARRHFLLHFGMTFQAYCRGRRLGEAFRQLKRGKNLDTIALDHGYESLSGFRDAFAKTFGKSPRQAHGACAVVSWIESPVSPLLVAATDAGLCALEFVGRTECSGQMDDLRKSLDMPVVPGTHPHLVQAERELNEYFAGTRRDFTVPLAPVGTPFQRAVWDQLREIPYGETWSYQQLASSVNKSPSACRAVGQANGRNRIVILIPCHRVVNKDGSLGGYGGGLWRKRFLLELERKHR
ncbi:MAG TPA: methylated-DNA--[protein]-cysteine S-methyltransferase [Gemmataceae bacterium]|nr:methylated-DNA--[protein]-cysteine S-methyltransferase [Gemmataceae bacterium]